MTQSTRSAKASPKRKKVTVRAVTQDTQDTPTPPPAPPKRITAKAAAKSTAKSGHKTSTKTTKAVKTDKTKADTSKNATLLSEVTPKPAFATGPTQSDLIGLVVLALVVAGSVTLFWLSGRYGLGTQ